MIRERSERDGGSPRLPCGEGRSGAEAMRWIWCASLLLAVVAPMSSAILPWLVRESGPTGGEASRQVALLQGGGPEPTNCECESTLQLTPVCAGLDTETTHCAPLAQGFCATQRCKICIAITGANLFAITEQPGSTFCVKVRDCRAATQQKTYRCRWIDGQCKCDPMMQILPDVEPCEVKKLFADRSGCIGACGELCP